MKPPLLVAHDLARHYRVSRGLLRGHATVRALDGVSFALEEGRTLAVVGESGCGKSTLARAVTMIEPPTSGLLQVDGIDIAHASTPARRLLRPLVQMVFQNPYASLNPRKRIGVLLEEPLVIQGRDGPRERRARALEIGARRAACRALRPLSAHVLRRAAAAHRHRAGTDAAAAPGGR